MIQSFVVIALAIIAGVVLGVVAQRWYQGTLDSARARRAAVTRAERKAATYAAMNTAWDRELPGDAPAEPVAAAPVADQGA